MFPLGFVLPFSVSPQTLQNLSSPPVTQKSYEMLFKKYAKEHTNIYLEADRSWQILK